MSLADPKTCLSGEICSPQISATFNRSSLPVHVSPTNCESPESLFVSAHVLPRSEADRGSCMSVIPSGTTVIKM